MTCVLHLVNRTAHTFQFHGIKQNGTMFSDGVPGVTQKFDLIFQLVTKD